MNKKIKLYKSKSCYCHKIPQVTHDISQSLLIINVYVKGCIERLKADNLDPVQLSKVFEKITKHVDLVNNKIYSLV